MRIGIDIDDTIACTTGLTEIEMKKRFSNDISFQNKKIDYNSEDIISFFKEKGDYLLLNVEPKKDAVSVINKLKNKGHEIFFITTRNSFYFNDPYALSYEWLMKNNFLFDELIVNANDKKEICKKYNIDIFIDDNVYHYQSVLNSNIKSYLFTSSNNKEINVINRIDNWNEFYKLFN